MNTELEELQAILARVEKLERVNRGLKKIGVVVLVAACVSLLMGQAKSPAKVESDGVSGKRVIRAEIIKANRIELTTKQGNVRAVIRAYDGGSSLTMFDEYGKAHLLLVGGLAGGALQIGDLKEPTGEADDWIYSNGNPSVSLHPGLLELKDTSGKRVMNIVVGSDSSTLNLGPNAVMRVGVINGYHTEIGTSDLVTPSTGEEHRTSDASVVLFNDKGNVIWRAPN